MRLSLCNCSQERKHLSFVFQNIVNKNINSYVSKIVLKAFKNSCTSHLPMHHTWHASTFLQQSHGGGNQVIQAFRLLLENTRFKSFHVHHRTSSDPWCLFMFVSYWPRLESHWDNRDFIFQLHHNWFNNNLPSHHPPHSQTFLDFPFFPSISVEVMGGKSPLYPSKWKSKKTEKSATLLGPVREAETHSKLLPPKLERQTNTGSMWGIQGRLTSGNHLRSQCWGRKTRTVIHELPEAQCCQLQELQTLRRSSHGRGGAGRGGWGHNLWDLLQEIYQVLTVCWRLYFALCNIREKSLCVSDGARGEGAILEYARTLCLL